MIREWTTTPWRVMLSLAICMVTLMTGHAQQPGDDAATLGARLRVRYDIVALQQGVALVPRQQNPAIRMIEIHDGAVSINGDEVTGRQLRDRVGADADLILKVSYLSAAEQRTLAVSSTPASAAGPAAQTPSTAAPPGAPAPSAGAPPPAPSPSDTAPQRRRGDGERRDGDRVRVMGDVTVGPGERVEGDVVAVMGNAQIDGEVDGDLNVVMGSATLGPAAVVTGDVNIVGGRLNRAPGARVDGAVHNVGSDVASGGTGSRPTMRTMIRNSLLGRIGSLAFTLVRIALIALFAVALVAFGRTWVERVADRAATDPLRAGLVGFAAQILFVPILILTVVVLAISIVGIPLLALIPFAILLAVIGLILGFSGVAFHVGRMLTQRFGWSGRGEYVTVLVGVVAIAALTLLARSVALVTGAFLGWPLLVVGLIVEYAAWTLGLGAAILVIPRRRRTPPVPPPIPA